jgi:hypothetical protein
MLSGLIKIVLISKPYTLIPQQKDEFPQPQQGEKRDGKITTQEFLSLYPGLTKFHLRPSPSKLKRKYHN